MVLHQPPFRIYFYEGSQKVATYIAQRAPQILREVEALVQYRDPDLTFDILVYRTPQELRQTNLGRQAEFWNIGWISRIQGTRIFVAFQGSYANLDQQLRDGLLRILLDRSLFAGALQSIIRTLTGSSDLPGWLVETYFRYVNNGWQATLPDLCLWLTPPTPQHKLRFAKLLKRNPLLAGMTFWYTLNQHLPTNRFIDFLALAYQDKSIETALFYVAHMTPDSFHHQWQQTMYTLQQTICTTRRQTTKMGRWRPPLLAKSWTTTSITGTHQTALLTAHQSMGRWKIKYWTWNEKRNRFQPQKTLLRGGFRNLDFPTDPSHPIIALAPDASTLAAFIYKQGDWQFILWTPKQTEQRPNQTKTRWKKTRHPFPYFDDIHSATFLTSDQILLTATQAGETDAYLLDVHSLHLKRIPQPGDQIHTAYGKTQTGQRGIYLLTQTPPSYTWTISFHPLSKTKNTPPPPTIHLPTSLQPLTLLQQHATTYFVYQRADSSIHLATLTTDTYFVRWDTCVLYQDSIYINPQPPDSTWWQQIDSLWYVPVYRDTIYIQEIAQMPYIPLTTTWFSPHGMLGTGPHAYPHLLWQPWQRLDKPKPLNTSDSKPTLHTPMTTLPPAQQQEQEEQPQPQTSQTRLPPYFPPLSQEEVLPTTQTQTRKRKILPYFPRLSLQYFVSQFDNSILWTPYIALETLPTDQYPLPDLSPFFRLALTDLMEDWTFEGGFRISTNADQIELFGRFLRLRKRLDYQFLYFYRQLQGEFPFFYLVFPYRIRTHLFLNSWTYPFTEVVALQTELFFRYDRLLFYVIDPISLQIPTFTTRWIGARLALKWNNTRSLGINLPWGLRGHLWIEWRRKIDSLSIPQQTLYPANDWLGLLGIDWRQYIRINRWSVLAFRTLAAHSFGPSTILFLLGGVESWLNPLPQENTPPAPNYQWRFASIVTPLRGHPLNIRNGKSTLLINTEYRWYLFRSLQLFPTSHFFQNLMVVAFGDIGTAWVGTSPYDEENPINQDIISNGPITIIARYQREPFVWSWGWGLRFLILGYMLRVDIAYPYEEFIALPPVLLFSLSLDF